MKIDPNFYKYLNKINIFWKVRLFLLFQVTYEGQAKYPDPPAGGYPGGSGQAAGAGGGYRY